METTISKDTNTYSLKRKYGILSSSHNTTSGNSITIPKSSAPKNIKLAASLQYFLYKKLPNKMRRLTSHSSWSDVSVGTFSSKYTNELASTLHLLLRVVSNNNTSLAKQKNC